MKDQKGIVLKKRKGLLIGGTIVVVFFLIWAAQFFWKSDTQNKYSFLHDGLFRVSAHRGARLFAPENTLESIEKAIQYQYGAIEIDPRRSLDGEIYLMHDNDVSRMTDGEGAIEKMHNQEIENLSINVEGYPVYKGEHLKIPTFQSAVKLLAGREMVLNIDCSKGNWKDSAYIDRVVEILNANHMLQWSFFVISDEETRAMVEKRYPNLCISWLFDPKKMSIERYIDSARNVKNPVILSVKDEYADRETLNELLHSGIYFQIYSVTDESRKIELKELGVPMIETDCLLP
ncbi:glycerophosphodiester phosphodiesterase [[Clostridium] aminophilum]|uniref:glycerophosphodiester phosphodiesterase n=1 Tax=[Clostridium] aminophilum TaxID=1526 RepID=UPI003F99B736